MSDDISDFDDIPTAKLEVPKAADVPLWVHSNTVAIRGITRRLARRESFEDKLFWVVIGGSFGVILSVVSAAVYIGGELSSLHYLQERATRNDERITHLEQQAMKRRDDT